MATKAITLKLDGFEKLLDRFEKLPVKMQRKGVIGGLRRASKVTLERTLSLAPTDTGDMKRFIEVRSLKRSRKRVGVAIFAPSRRQLGIPSSDRVKGGGSAKNAGYYPAFVEYGTRYRRGTRFMTHALNQTKARAIATMAKFMRRQVALFALGKK